jgi:hypothetical protein
MRGGIFDCMEVEHTLILSARNLSYSESGEFTSRANNVDALGNHRVEVNNVRTNSRIDSLAQGTFAANP